MPAHYDDIGTPERAQWHCWNCAGRWPDEDAAAEHQRHEPSHRVTRSSDTWHGEPPRSL